MLPIWRTVCSNLWQYFVQGLAGHRTIALCLQLFLLLGNLLRRFGPKHAEARHARTPYRTERPSIIRPLCCNFGRHVTPRVLQWPHSSERWLSSDTFPAWKGRITAPVSRLEAANDSAKGTGVAPAADRKSRCRGRALTTTAV